MKSIVFKKAFETEVVENEIKSLGEREVLIKILRIGVCGTDIQVFSGRNRYMKFPLIPFHEGVAKVVKCGPKCSKVIEGDLVSINPIMNCGDCYSCKKGKVNACEKFICLGVQTNGLGSEQFVIDENHLYSINVDISLDSAIFIEPLAVGVHAVQRENIYNKNVLVLGAGTIGNLVAQSAKILGAKLVCICDLSEDKLEIARSCGIDLAVNNSLKDLREVMNDAFESSPDVIIDCVGSPKLFNNMLDVVSKTTTIIIVGNYSVPFEVDLAKIQRNELSVFGSITYTPDDFQMAVDLINDNKVNTERLISKRFKFIDVQEMMEDSLNNRNSNMKIIMDY